MNIQEYITTINKRYQSGIAREHTYRTDLESLIRELVPEVEITNEPANVTDCGNPDYVITKKKIPIGFIEAKDIGKDITSKTYKEQFDRYRKALDNLIITDYIYFRFYDHGNLVHEIRIAEIENNTIKAFPDNFAQFENLIQNFCTFIGQTIKSSKKLAEMMAAKARLLQNILENAVTSDEEIQENTSLRDQYKTFKDILIHDLTPKAFADIYAQTLAYGMFAARLHDKTLDDFSRQEAAELIPKSNPFLRKLFGYVAGPDIDERIVRTVDNLANVFLATNVEELLKNFGKSTQSHDPIIHFYETFLAEYDPKLRKSRGVWYTPEPVVNFIVRAVDDILKTEFNLPDGLADTTKTKIKVKEQGSNKAVEKEVHKVQILDPATGTGTFLAEVVKHIYKHKFNAMQGVWSSYIDEHLIPRLNGFELLMASYAMAHLKLDMLLTETGYKATKNQRFNIYLTNSLEEHHPDTGTLFSNWLSTEANEANHIKRDTPVMCVIGNPPYAVSSTNKSDWIQNLLKDYKKDLNERKINLDDDYIKFIRYGQHYINKNGEGILAYISNNSFIDGVTHRQMRKHLLETFDKVYILDLHGNSKKKETSPDGSLDQNVFDIMQGVSINIFVKKSKQKNHGIVNHYNLYGKRDIKYSFLNDNSILSIEWDKLEYKEPYFFFVPKDFKAEGKYKKGMYTKELFNLIGSGVSTLRDKITIHFNKKELQEVLADFNTFSEKEIQDKYNTKDSRDWTIETALKDIRNNYNRNLFNLIHYRPFDIRQTFYTGTNKGFIGVPQKKIANNFIGFENVGLIIPRIAKGEYNHGFISKYPVEYSCGGSHTAAETNIALLYLYPDKERDGMFAEDDLSEKGRKPNLNPEIVQKIADKLGLEFVAEKNPQLQDNFVQSPEANSPPLEGCPQGGVVKPEVITTINNIPIKRNFVKTLPHNPKLNQLAKDKRKAGILSEVLFWKQVHKKKFHAIDFDRQRIIGNYIVDFYAKTLGLVIEIDGSSHNNKEEYDAKRQKYLESLGLKVYRISDNHVKKDISQTMIDLENYIVNEYGETSPPAGHPIIGGEFAPIDILDYIYAVLHSPTYREKYKEFLKIDFPRVPYPKDAKTFWQLVKLGGEIRQIHLLESPKVNEYITQYPEDGDNKITTKIAKKDWVITQHGDTSPCKDTAVTGRIYINETQYFDNIPLVAWEFYIGGYQPAQKWLKDRSPKKGQEGRVLTYEDITHYQKIIVALTETDRIMKEIDKINIE